MVSPLPLSLATTHRISFDFFSSAYLDVSLRRVPFLKLWIYFRIHGSSPCGLPHSEICGYIAYLQLPAAYRSLSRPSSAPDAKAFTLCSCSLELFAKDFLFCCSRSLNCLSFFVHFRFAVKKLSPFHRFVFRLVFADRSALHSSKLYLLPYFLERPIFS